MAENTTYQPPIGLFNKISPLMNQGLDYSNGDKLRQQLSELQQIRYELAQTRCQWYEMLLRERERARMPKDRDYTEFDRKTILGASTSVIESDYDFLVSLESIIQERIQLGMIFLQTG